MVYSRMLLALALLSVQTAATAGDSTTPKLEAISPNLARLSGVESTSGITYVRLFLLQDAPHDPSSNSPPAFDISRATLTAQCTQDTKGKLHFELFVNFGNITDTAFYPPWRPTSPTDLFPPPNEKVTVTMEFLGFAHFKPVKRQFEKVPTPYGQLRYNNPHVGSSNLEEFSYYLQILKSLPTLRVSAGPQAATFLTTPLLTQLHNEPLCRASGL